MRHWVNSVWERIFQFYNAAFNKGVDRMDNSKIKSAQKFARKFLTRQQLEYPNFYVRYSHDIANVLGLRVCGAYVKNGEVAWKKQLLLVNALVIVSPVVLRVAFGSAGLDDTTFWTVYFVCLTAMCQLFSFAGVRVFHRLTPQLEISLTSKGMDNYKRWCSYTTALVPQLFAMSLSVALAVWVLHGIADKPIMKGGVDSLFWLAFIISAIYLSGGVWWIISGAILSWAISRPGCLKLFHPAPAFTPGVEALVRCYRMAFAGASIGCCSYLLPWLTWKKNIGESIFDSYSTLYLCVLACVSLSLIGILPDWMLSYVIQSERRALIEQLWQSVPEVSDVVDGKVDMVDSKSKLSSQFVLDYVSVVVSTPKTTASAGIVSLGVAMFSSFIPVVLAELVG